MCSHSPQWPRLGICFLSFWSYLWLSLPYKSHMSWVYSKTCQKETDAKPNCVGVVSLHFGVNKLSRGQKGTRYRHLPGFFFFFLRELLPEFSLQCHSERWRSLEQTLVRARLMWALATDPCFCHSRRKIRAGAHAEQDRPWGGTSWGPTWEISSYTFSYKQQKISRLLLDDSHAKKWRLGVLL